LIAYFEAQEGFEVLSKLAGQSGEFEVFCLASELIEKYRNAEDQSMDYFFEADYKKNGNNIYDDTKEFRI